MTRWRDKLTRFDAKHVPTPELERFHAWRTMHEEFGRYLAGAVGKLLRSKVDVRLIEVERLTYGELVGGLESPTCFQVFEAKPLEGKAVLEISPSIVFPMIDRLLGGGKEACAPARRPLTEIELRLARRITDALFISLRRAWEDVLPLEIAVTHVESYPRSAGILPRHDFAILTRFELSIASARGTISLAFPLSSLERVGRRGAPETRSASEAVLPDHAAAKGTLVELVARLAETRISSSELTCLGVGDIITTETHFESPLVVEVDGVARFHARPGLYKGRKALRFDEAIQPSEPSP
ncbi:MAG TPA: FliM/FliN family flagellar motor switch protein [Pirellulales bacterium]|jgi:flagellar motor switch protein FliM|nr:FliM/FliN family flagellar motor switch protein [Pirellulales bacterium]